MPDGRRTKYLRSEFEFEVALDSSRVIVNKLYNYIFWLLYKAECYTITAIEMEILAFL